MTISENKFYTADFGFNEAFDLHLDNGDLLFADTVVRLIPGRRLVMFGTWQGKEIVAKLFFDKKRAKKHVAKELRGVNILKDNNVPTPTLYLNCESADKQTEVLIFERITDAKNLYAIWQEKNHISDILLILHAVVTEIATQHVLGITQRDLHLKNFLISEKEVFNTTEQVSHERIHVYTLDGGEIESGELILAKKESMQNLALFLAQLGAGVESYQLLLFRYYAKQRGWAIKHKDIVELFQLIKQMNDERWSSYQKKIIRSSSDFVRMSDLHKVIMYDREYENPEFIQFLSQPDQLFIHSSVTLLKAGHSATVVKVILDGKPYVIKRYNVKGVFHWLRRAFRPTRAATCWRFAQKLRLLFIPTAKPVAYIEQRVLGLRGKSYYITEYIAGQHIGDYFAAHKDNQVAIKEMINRVSQLLKNLLSIQVTHGDLKMTNLLLDENEQPILIDLDGMKEHTTKSSLQSDWQKEWKRFLRNFDTQEEVKRGFEKELS